MKRCGYCDNEVDHLICIAHNYIECCKECAKEQDPHPCPFKQEIYGDSETMCTCGEAIIHECSMDI